jgi:hypothetical protein
MSRSRCGHESTWPLSGRLREIGPSGSLRDWLFKQAVWGHAAETIPIQSRTGSLWCTLQYQASERTVAGLPSSNLAYILEIVKAHSGPQATTFLAYLFWREKEDGQNKHVPGVHS